MEPNMSIAATSKKLATNTLAGLGAGTTATVSLTYPIAKGLYGLVRRIFSLVLVLLV